MNSNLLIFAVVTIPGMFGFIDMAENKTCEANRQTVERLYRAYLLENEHEDSNFTQFLNKNFNKVCPAGGVITFEEGKVKCNLYGDVDPIDEDESSDNEVPWL